MRPQELLFLALSFLVTFSLIQECDCVMSFTQPNDWIRVGEIFGSDGVRVVLWKPVCQHPAFRIGDVAVNSDFPPSGLYCVYVELVDAIPADTIVKHFEIQNNAILSATALENYTVSIGWFASAVENGNLNGSHLIDYATFDRECLHRCRNFRVISELGFGPRYSALIYNPFQMLGFSDEANLFIINDTATTSINSCLNQHCVCGPCEHGVCTEFGTCDCQLGWTGKYCNEDVDECELGIHECDPLVVCINTLGGYECGPCPPGYHDVFGNGRLCKDINECQNETICEGTGFVNCTNIPGSFVCTNCSIGMLDHGNGCELVLCGNMRIDPGEQCDGGLQCKNCQCAPRYEPTNPISLSCQPLCGNRRLDPGEECDSGIGCDPATCKCNRNRQYFPTSPPSLDCVQILTDPCLVFTNCSACVFVDCIWCQDSSTCRRSRDSNECSTKCEKDLPNIIPPPPSRNFGTGETVAIAISVIVALLLSGGIVIYVLWRRHKKQRDQYYKLLEMNGSSTATNMSKYGIERSNLYISSIVEEWEPPEDSKAVPLTDLPFIISKEKLDFNIGLNQFRVGQNYFDSFVISFPSTTTTTTTSSSSLSSSTTKSKSKTKSTSKYQKLESIEIVFHPPKTPKFNVMFNPERCIVKKDKSVEVIVSLIVNMTTETEMAIGIELPELKVHAFLIEKISSELSPLIDIDEIHIDNTKIVGDGAYGTVYRGTYRGQDVAVKMLKIQDLPEGMIDEFDREIDLMTKLRHKNIVQFIGASKVVGKLAIVTEFIEGGNVLGLLKKKKISYALKLKIALDTARALNFLQQNKILHRDLKPDNLLIVSKSTDPFSITVKLADFGTSRAVSEKLANKYTMGIGTPIYMAPEILNKKQYDLRADIYSFGMILWVLYTQQEPYNHLEHSWDVARFVLEGKRESIPKDCPNDYRKLIERCWDGDPNNRPTCEEILSELERMLRNELNKTSQPIHSTMNPVTDPNVYILMSNEE